MPKLVKDSFRFPLWNLAQEFHTCRIYSPIISSFYILIVPLAGISLIVSLSLDLQCGSSEERKKGSKRNFRLILSTYLTILAKQNLNQTLYEAKIKGNHTTPKSSSKMAHSCDYCCWNFYGHCGLCILHRNWSYVSDDPATCVNCHIMRPEYVTWHHSPHREHATCNDCHVPHDNVFRKYYFKGADGMRHATIFTLNTYS